MLKFIYVLITIITTLAVGELIGYGIHNLAHRWKNSTMNEAHMSHHLKFYPPGKYVSDKYIYAGKDSFTFWFIPIVLCLIGISFYFLPFYLALISTGTLLFDGYLNDYTHKQYHLRKSYWLRFYWFRRLRVLHFLHHKDMLKNMGIYQFETDKLFGSYTDKKSNRP